MKNKKAMGCGCLGLVVGLAFIILFLASAYMLNYALKPSHNKGRDYASQWTAMQRRYPWAKPWMDSLRQAHALRDTFIMVAGGEKRLMGGDSMRLHALMVPAQRSTGRTAVLIPGYTDCAIDMLHVGYIYHHRLGMNLLIPELRANGKSEGQAMQMGWRDRLDVLQWLRVADRRFRDSTGHAAIVVHGISMGAATAMNVAGELESSDIKSSVKCFVEDCGYTSAWDEFSDQLHQQFGLPDFPLLYTASALCKMKYGWSFGECSPLSQVSRCHKPMLFIHGAADDYVPTRMVYPLYQAKPAPKQLVLFRGAGHARSLLSNPGRYTRVVTTFVGRYVK